MIRQEYAWSYFYTFVGIGTPPQLMRLLLAVDFDGVVVPSSRCRSEACDWRRRYNHDLSSTYDLPSNQHYYSEFPSVFTAGPAAEDVLSIGDLVVQEQTFEEATQMSDGMELVEADGIFGLSRRSSVTEENNITALNPLLNIAKQGLLEQNMFSITLPSDASMVGELILGGIGTYPAGALKTVPLTERHEDDNDLESFLASGWQTGIYSVEVGAYQGRKRFEVALDNHTISFSTQANWCTFPDSVWSAVTQHINVDSVSGEIDCAKRHDLPDIILMLGVGDRTEELVLTPYEYVVSDDLWAPDQPGRCMVPWSVLVDETKFVMLGTHALKKFHMVFDLDNASFSCEYWPSAHPASC